jgi:predicted aldo/keto reductase-like oxidoreductase
MNREDHIEENLRIADEAHPESLSDKELEIVNRAAETYGGLMKAGCTGCRYCMPCPAGVDIPTCFDIYNGAHIFGDKQVARVLYLLRLGGVGDSGKAAYASMCEHCGTCEEVCPQHLPVQALLEDVAKDFEGRGSKAVARLVSLFLGVPRWRAFRRARRMEKRKSFSSRS